MTIVLKRQATTRLELPGDLVITAKVADAAMFELAANIARADAVAIRDGEASASSYGLEDEAFAGGPPIEIMTAIALGRLTITEWEGVADEGGKAAEVTPENIALVLKDWSAPGVSYGFLFGLRMRGLKTLGRDAKNGSTASPDTSTAAAGTTAESAGQPETPAPAAG